MSAAVRGVFVAFEGIEGAGKTSQIERLARRVRALGREVVATREPGGTDLSEAIRGLLLRRDGPRIAAWSELLLYVAARAQLVTEVIRPALVRGAVVIADRYGGASVAYQGGGRRLGVARVRVLNRWATEDLRPDRVLLLDLPPEVGLARVRRGRGTESLDRIESEDLAFHRRVRAAYRREASRDPRRIRRIDATAAPDHVEAEIWDALRRLLSPAPERRLPKRK